MRRQRPVALHLSSVARGVTLDRRLRRHLLGSRPRDAISAATLAYGGRHGVGDVVLGVLLVQASGVRFAASYYGGERRAAVGR